MEIEYVFNLILMLFVFNLFVLNLNVCVEIVVKPKIEINILR